MGKSGFTTLLMLLLAAIIVLLVVDRTVGGGLWSKLTGQAQEPAPTHEVTTPRLMTPADGMRQVEQTRRELEAMDSLAQSVHPRP